MTNQEILAYARKGILAERRFCVRMRDKALQLVDTYGEYAQKLVDDFQRDIDDLDSKLADLEETGNKE